MQGAASGHHFAILRSSSSRNSHRPQITISAQDLFCKRYFEQGIETIAAPVAKNSVKPLRSLV
jgi:hypothetical protein